MSIRILIAGYCLSLFAAIVGCVAIVRSKHAGPSLWWLISALGCAFTGALCFAGIPFLPDFFTILVANEALLIAFVLLHQAIVSILESRQRYIGLGLLLVGSQFFFLFHFTYVSPDIRARILVRTLAIVVQVTVSITVLLRAGNSSLQSSIRAAIWTFTAFLLLQASRVVTTTFWWKPMPDRLHPGPAGAFYNVFDFISGLGCAFVVVWMILCAKRRDLQTMATTDGLSGLMNRRAFDELLEDELRGAERRREPIALLLIDLDRFKSINDRFGHLMGDEVIRRVSQLLCVNTRAADAVARYGGEEFVMLLRGMRLEQAESIAERLRTQIEAMAGLPDSIRVTASIGIAMKDADDTVASLMERSDQALYFSKRAGRNRVSTEYAYSEC